MLPDKDYKQLLFIADGAELETFCTCRSVVFAGKQDAEAFCNNLDFVNSVFKQTVFD